LESQHTAFAFRHLKGNVPKRALCTVITVHRKVKLSFHKPAPILPHIDHPVRIPIQDKILGGDHLVLQKQRRYIQCQILHTNYTILSNVRTENHLTYGNQKHLTVKKRRKMDTVRNK
jgi:hypothetical protein